MKIIFPFLFLLFSGLIGFAQNSKIAGEVRSRISSEPLPFATIRIQETSIGATSDFDGIFQIVDLAPGVYNVEATLLGFKKAVVFEVEVSSSRTTNIIFEMESAFTELQEAVITESSQSNMEESPVSVRTIGVNEIRRSPGGNRDISKTIRSLPGVAQIPSFRNDIIVRGGAPNENRFYIDGIEIPNINHFATQGASGGPVGLINVDFIDEVEFYSGAFPAGRGNALSSVMALSFKEPKAEKLRSNLVVGTSDLGLTLEGPTGKNSGYIFSVRRSYLQALFSLLQLPFLPTYNDAQFKWKIRLGDRDQISVLGLGALDDFRLNTELSVDSSSENYQRNIYILDNLVSNKQWNYTLGTKWDHYTDWGKVSMVVSRNALKNDAFKYQNNNENLPLVFDYSSRETENKTRLEFAREKNGWKLNGGISYEWVEYLNRSQLNEYQPQNDSIYFVNYDVQYEFTTTGIFLQTSKEFFEDALIISGGVRMDRNSFSDAMANLFDQTSPRISARWKMGRGWSVSANTGIYYQRPSYVILGYQEHSVFQNTEATYIRNHQSVAGLEYYNSPMNAIFSLEGFYKGYSNYPVSDSKGISLANLGADFGIVGNEKISSVGLGKAYGVEFLWQQKLYKGYYGIFTYTYVRSEFTGLDNKYVPSSWDSRHLLSTTGGKKLKRNWEVGFRFQFSGGLPYTPDNVESSMRIENWEIAGVAQTDWPLINTERIPAFHQLDIRVDKKWFFKKWALEAFLDIQNIYGNTTPLKPVLDVVRDSSGNPIPDPLNKGYYQPVYIDNFYGSVLPGIGLVIEL